MAGTDIYFRLLELTQAIIPAAARATNAITSTASPAEETGKLGDGELVGDGGGGVSV
jgi:hypothetical protein